MSVRRWLRTWRVALRFAARDARRNRARSLLVAVMVGLPVLAGAAVDVAGRSAQLDPQDLATVKLGTRAAALVQAGNGDQIVQSPDGEQTMGMGSDDAGAQRERQQRLPHELPPGRLLPYLVADGVDARIGDRSLSTRVVELAYDDPALAGWAEQVAGRPPVAPDEVAVSDRFASDAGVRVGDGIVLHAATTLADGSRLPDRRVTVVGVVRGASFLGADQVIGRPGALLPDQGAGLGASRSWFVDGPPVSWEQVRALNALGATVVSRAVLAAPPPLDPQLVSQGSPASATVVGILTVAAVLVLLQITLLAGPALAVGARRNQRTLGIMAAAGGSPAALRRAVLASGFVVGLVSSIVCAAVGVLVVQVSRRSLEDYAGQPLPRLDLHALDLAAVVAVGTGTALAASLVPALQAGRADVVAALAGRRGQAAPRAWVPVTGLVLVGGGLLLALWAAYAHQPFAVSVGLALGEFGLVAMSGTLVVLASRLAPRLPLAGRLALRDAARQRGRTAPAVAAVLAVVAGCCATAVYTAALDVHDQATYTPQAAPGAVVVRGTPALDMSAAEAAVRSTMPVRAVAQLRDLHGGGAEPEMRGDRSGGYRLVSTGTIVDDGAAVAALTGQDDPRVRAALRAGKAVVFDPAYLTADGLVRMHVFVDPTDAARTGNGAAPGPQERVVALPAELVTLPLGLEAAVLPPSALPALGKGLSAEVTGLLATTTRTPTQEEEQRLGARLVNGFAYVERGYRSPYPIFLLVVGIASVVVALGSTLAVVGLAAAEGRADVATLAAVGAAPRVRRRLAAAQAGVVAVLGTVLGCVSGIVSGITLVVLSRRDITASSGSGTLRAGWEIVVPWERLSVLVVGLPLLAVVAAALFTRSRLPMVRRLGQ